MEDILCHNMFYNLLANEVNEVQALNLALKELFEVNHQSWSLEYVSHFSVILTANA